LNKQYDLVLASDILFFEEFHSDLIALLQFYKELNPDLVFLCVNKERGGSIKRFTEKAKTANLMLNSLKVLDQQEEMILISFGMAI
jgi:predicted nicotinamide N-methyase